MEVDGEIDQNLMQQFSSMGTTDRDVLIAEFQKLLGNQLNAAGCAFFLDMNNWNLQDAVCAYYDLEQPKSERTPSMSFVRDITIGEGESVPPKTNFVKTWRLQNTGSESWPPACNLRFVYGERMSAPDRVMVDVVTPGQFCDVSVNLVSPDHNGIYQSQWRMSTPTGLFFGEIIWAILCVEETGVLGVTQQMSQIGDDFIPHTAVRQTNPFCGDGMLAPCFDDMGSSPQGSPNCSIIAQHGSPQRLLNESFAQLSPIRPLQTSSQSSMTTDVASNITSPLCSSTENLYQDESMVS